jgi:peptide/nickel transport system substrate-binding protein
VRRYGSMIAAGVLVVALAALAAGCGSSSKSSSSGGSSSSSSSSNNNSSGASSNNPYAGPMGGAGHKGGTYTVGWEQQFGFTDGFDPTGEYLGDAWGILSNLMVRTLVGYRHTAGVNGNKPVPDLATSLPQPTNGGKTYTFHLKSGIKFGPPVNRAVTSKDIAYAMERLANPKNQGGYAFYYTVIKGWNAFAAGKAKTISGISTPNNNTIVFNLTQPAGDFLFRMSMPATGPIPPEVGKCFDGKPGAYGRDIISTAGYMFLGADKAKIGCPMKPMPGYSGTNQITLVRNPNYNQSTDPYRKNYPDKFAFVVNTNVADIFNRVQTGAYDDEDSNPPSNVIQQYVSNSSLHKYLHVNAGDRTWYITMNLTQPPFDDIHVRKAMNFIMDKVALRRQWGGPIQGPIAGHIVPDALLNNELLEYNPYKTPGDTGDVAKASAEMKKSKYDPGHTGKCTASACKHILMIADTIHQYQAMVPVIEADAAKIGITFTVRTVNKAYNTIQVPSKNIPISDRPGWGKDYPDPLTFFQALFTSSAIIPANNTNYSLVGVTPAIAKKVGAKGNLNNVPSVDPQFNHCNSLTGGARVTCWGSLDKYLMTNVVPWVPYLFQNTPRISAKTVTHWDWDQFTGTAAYSQVAVK